MKRIKLGLPVKGDKNRTKTLREKWNAAKELIWGWFLISMFVYGCWNTLVLIFKLIMS